MVFKMTTRVILFCFATLVLLSFIYLLYTSFRLEDGTQENFPSPLDLKCNLAFLNTALHLTRRDSAGRISCSDLPVNISSLPGYPSWAKLLSFGWRPEFDDCSLGVFLPRTAEFPEDAKSTIRSLLYLRSTPLTFYIAADIKSAELIESWFLHLKFPYIRVLICPLGVLQKSSGVSLSGLMSVWRRGLYMTSYLYPVLWALPKEKFMVVTATDMVHAVDPLEVVKSFVSTMVGSEWFAASRAFYYEMLNRQHIGVGSCTPMVWSVTNVKNQMEEYLMKMKKSIFQAKKKNELEWGDMSVITQFKQLFPEKMVATGCQSFTDVTNIHFYNGSAPSLLCNTIPKGLHLKSTFYSDTHPTIAFVSQMAKALRSIPDPLLQLCPFTVNQDGPGWVSPGSSFQVPGFPAVVV